MNGARRILGIPPEIVPFAYVAVGYADEKKEARTRYDATRVHRDRW
jgi:hypothetical protein